jgi:hypothetical protein
MSNLKERKKSKEGKRTHRGEEKEFGETRKKAL